MSDELPTSERTAPEAKSAGRSVIPWIIAAIVVVVLVLGGVLFHLARRRVNKVALIEAPKGVTVIAARAGNWQPQHRYVGTVEPWVEARIGPQFTSAYVETVLVRPGAAVKQGQVLATLDCRNASEMSRAVEMQAKALAARQEALAHEAARIGRLLSGGFASRNEVEMKNAESVSKEAEVLATRAELARASLEVNDCILRAPFDGEVAIRAMDPGAFARPGATIISMVDRRIVRVTADVPEADFDLVLPGTQALVRPLARATQLTAAISRRAPAADTSTRTVHFEVDLRDDLRALPVRTTAEIVIDAGEPEPATVVPLIAATVRGQSAILFVVEGDRAHKVKATVKGEREGSLYLDPALKPGTKVVTEGRTLLKDNDVVSAQEEAASP